MEAVNKDSILKEIPLFSDLSEEEQALIKERVNFVEYKKGQNIYEEGSCADAFSCVILGRVVIYTKDQDGNETILEYLHHGKYFGIISLLTGEAHSVTAKAINDCLILAINKEDFNFLLNKIPRLAIDLGQTLSRRLKRKDVHQKTIFESTVISVFSSHSQAGKTIYALNLGLGLKRETQKSVMILDIATQDKAHSLPGRLGLQGEHRVLDLSLPLDTAGTIKDFLLKDNFGVDLICLSYQPQDDACLKRLVNVLSRLVNDYHYIILDLPAYMDRIIFQMLNQSDLIHILTGTEPVELEKTHNLIERLKSEFHFQESKIKIIINEYKFSKLTYEQQLEILKYPVLATLPKIELAASDRLVLDAANCEYARAMRRVSRTLGDRLVGLALGVGVGYAFCHIGVLKVIEEEKIPIDVVSGSSTGALIASLWATGKSSQEILEIAREFREPKYIWSIVDLTFPKLGFIKGNKLYGFLKKHLGNKTFRNVRLPLRIIASDVRKKESRVIDKGLLVDALMASCAMPGVFRPFGMRAKEEMLLDGGVINPLPTEVLLKMGVRKIIAVNVTPSRQDIQRQYEKIKEGMSLSPAISPQRRWFTPLEISPKKGGIVKFLTGFSLRQYLREAFRINILDIIFSSIEVMQSEMAQQEAQLADIVLHPDTSGLYWLELHRAAEFARRGEAEARRNLEKIWQVINE
ncbi:MAG: cyclic nucleotide-binding domain-containing protein [Candidatus Omnitrophica bacterium]|nr:cyclic nucleotide-binding domain-containing protein [Candidatus Omnitrophota bacterium]